MTDNMDLIQKISKLRENIQKQERAKTESENKYKQTCTKFGVKPAKTLEDLENKQWLSDNSNVLVNIRNPDKANDQETIMNLRDRHEDLRSHIEMLKGNLEDIRNEEMHIEQYLNEN